MAKILGQSGAYKGVLEALARVNLSINSLSELTTLKASLTDYLKVSEKNATVQFEAAVLELKKAWHEAEANSQQAAVEIKISHKQEENEIESLIITLKDQRLALGPLTKNLYPFSRLYKWVRLSFQIKSEQNNLESIDRKLTNEIKSLGEQVAKKSKSMIAF